MSAIMNGLVLHGGLLPYGATFLMLAEALETQCAWQR